MARETKRLMGKKGAKHLRTMRKKDRNGACRTEKWENTRYRQTGSSDIRCDSKN